MNSRDRVLCAMNLEESDRVPLDIELTEEPYEELLRYCNIKESPVSEIPDKIKLSSALSCDLLVFEADPPEGWKPKVFEDGSYIDEWGILRKFKIRGTIDWFEKHPIRNREDLDNYEFPNPTASGRFSSLESALKKFHSEFAILSGIGFSLWERAWTLHGFYESLMDFYQNPDFMEELLDRIVEYDVELAKIIVEYDIDAFRLGDDYGGQKDLLFSPETWRRFIKPRLKKITNVVQSRGLPVVLHTCGNIWKILNDLSEAGVTVLNPVQPKAMNPTELKQKFGDLFCFYGSLDLQETLAFGGSEEVKNEVQERIKTVGLGGGLILAPAHAVPPGVPIENILTIVRSVIKLGKYSRI